MRRTILILGAILVASCRRAESDGYHRPPASYFDNGAHADAWTGGARKLTISTPKGPHQVWIKRVGNNPKLKLLLLTGGQRCGANLRQRGRAVPN